MTRKPPFRPVRETLDLLLAPGSVAELRAIGSDGRVSSGYFDDFDRMADAIEPMDASHEYQGCYVTLNPVNPALLARRANRVVPRCGRKDATTSDGDIVSRRWLPVDVDAVRPSGVSSTGEEHAAARALARTICEALSEEGWPRPIVADSGNGGHLLYRIDLENDADATALVKAVLAALDARFSTASAKVDTANFNAARIWKCYGTLSRKGDSTADRPHRRSSIVAKPFEVEVVTIEQLRALTVPAIPTTISPPAAPATGFDLRAWLARHGLAVSSEKPWQGGTLFALAQCPFSDDHADGAFAVQFPNGAVHAGCQHERCGSRKQRWPELRARFEGTETPPPEPPPPADLPDGAVAAKAKEVLETGDPFRYFLECFAEEHVGDEILARCLVMSIASQTIRNTRGMHVYVTGESGKGKSSGMIAMLRQVPKTFRLDERLSDRALYYSDDIVPGTVLMLDDIALSVELQEVFKEATTKFKKRIRMRVVSKERKIQHCTIPERCAWWLANVSSLYDDQVLNRVLICWVDDSEEQDREVFERKLELEERDPDEAICDSFALRVCREMWWILKEQGLVYVKVPFARRIRMASVRNRRNPDVLLDLIRSHALVHFFQRERRTLKDGRPSIVATEADFDAAAALFVDLHTTGGSLTSKFDRNEQQVLSLASLHQAECFDLADLQRWIGWNYQKARRLLLGYESRGIRYPGLLDKTPALSLIDQTVSEVDREGRDVKRRALVFTFDEQAYRKSLYAGQVWLDEHGSFSSFSRRDAADRRAERRVEHRSPGGSKNDGDTEEIESRSVSSAGGDDDETGSGDPSPPVCGRRAESPNANFDGLRPDAESRPVPRKRSLSADVAPAETAERVAIDPHGFIAIGGPEWEACAVCGRKPSHFREKWFHGITERRRLCQRCYGATAGREQAKVSPLPGTVDLSAMRRVGAEVGRCALCDLAPATWSGGGVRLCDACFQREVRRGIEHGESTLFGIDG
jgi:hypothetical protein